MKHLRHSPGLSEISSRQTRWLTIDRRRFDRYDWDTNEAFAEMYVSLVTALFCLMSFMLPARSSQTRFWNRTNNGLQVVHNNDNNDDEAFPIKEPIPTPCLRKCVKMEAITAVWRDVCVYCTKQHDVHVNLLVDDMVLFLNPTPNIDTMEGEAAIAVDANHHTRAVIPESIHEPDNEQLLLDDELFRILERNRYYLRWKAILGWIRQAHERHCPKMEPQGGHYLRLYRENLDHDGLVFRRKFFLFLSLYCLLQPAAVYFCEHGWQSRLL